MTWQPTTDDDFPYPEVAEKTLIAMREYGSGQAEMSGYDKINENEKRWTVAVVDGPRPFAVHINWREQTLVTAQRENE